EPNVRLGAEEVFTVLENATNPAFLFQQGAAFCGGDDGGGFGCASSDNSPVAVSDGLPPPDMPDPVVVQQSTAGPFDFAVVRADDKAPMLDWLRENRYLVPAGGEDLLDPYIGAGQFFLALKLRSGQSTGDLQPIVIDYESDMPMIPLVLTRLGAVEDMGVLVWVLGDTRAVPLNYQHVQLNEEYVDWVNGAGNYAEVVARAVDEAQNGHAFVTEYADTNANIIGILDAPGRFGRRDQFEQLNDALLYVGALEENGFPMAALRPVFERVFPLPERAVMNGIQPEEYYSNLSTSLATFDPTPAGFEPLSLTAEIWERVVEPTIAAGAMFRRYDFVTRMFTAISPEEMTLDPFFGFNPDLPTISNLSSAIMIQSCGDNDWDMTLSDGRSYSVNDPSDWVSRSTRGAPRAAIIETLGLEGPPTIVVDNRNTLRDLSQRSAARMRRAAGLFNLFFLLASVMIARRALRH
ncbi:MAG: DUF2330 domain-containing protein, partial [Myxococcota bacterium]